MPLYFTIIICGLSVEHGYITLSFLAKPACRLVKNTCEPLKCVIPLVSLQF